MALLDWLGTVARSRPNSPLPTPSRQAQILRDPYYRFQSIAEVQQAAALGVTLDVNQAGVDDWLRLPGMSIHQARSLVDLSHSGVQFLCLEDLAAALGVPLQRLQPLAPILKFCYYAAESLQTPQGVNPNTATIESLTRIPGVDLFLARAIVQHRSTGPYRNMADLQRRLALPAHTTSNLMYYLRF